MICQRHKWLKALTGASLAMAAPALAAESSVVALSRDQVVAIWRDGGGILCLRDGYDIRAFRLCIGHEMTLALEHEKPGSINFTKMGLEPGGAARWQKVCPYAGTRSLLACAGIRRLVGGRQPGTDSQAARTYSRQVMGWVAGEPIGANVIVSDVMKAMQKEDQASQ